MKFFSYLVWISLIFALILMIFGTIQILWGTAFLGVVHVINFFHLANSLLLLTICFKLLGKCPDENK